MLRTALGKASRRVARQVSRSVSRRIPRNESRARGAASPFQRAHLGVYLMAAALGAINPMAPVAASEVGAHDEHSFHEPFHVVGVFIGDTTEDRRAEEGLTLGVEYEYRATERFGVGFTAEHVAGDFNTNVFVLPLALHRGPWKVYAGPGIERADRGNETLLRLGAEYGFRWGEYEISPQVDVDFVDGERLFVIGLVFAREL